jgi:hypothetical protein
MALLAALPQLCDVVVSCLCRWRLHLEKKQMILCAPELHFSSPALDKDRVVANMCNITHSYSGIIYCNISACTSLLQSGIVHLIWLGTARTNSRV